MVSLKVTFVFKTKQNTFSHVYFSYPTGIHSFIVIISSCNYLILNIFYRKTKITDLKMILKIYFCFCKIIHDFINALDMPILRHCISLIRKWTLWKREEPQKSNRPTKKKKVYMEWRMGEEMRNRVFNKVRAVLRFQTILHLSYVPYNRKREKRKCI